MVRSGSHSILGSASKQISILKAQAGLEEAPVKMLTSKTALFSHCPQQVSKGSRFVSFAHFFFAKQNGIVTAYQMLVGSGYKS